MPAIRTLRACPVCGVATTSGRCPTHAYAARYQWTEHRQARAQVLAAAQVCAICRQPERVGDPFTVDHIVPASLGGGSQVWNLRAVHHSCNSRRGTGGGGSSRADGRALSPRQIFAKET